jgi:hypothetical protein
LNPDPDWIQTRIGIQLDPDPDPDQMNTDPQPWRKEGEKEEGEEEEEKERDTSEEPSLLESVMRASTLAAGTRPPGIEEGLKVVLWIRLCCIRIRFRTRLWIWIQPVFKKKK